MQSIIKWACNQINSGETYACGPGTRCFSTGDAYTEDSTSTPVQGKRSEIIVNSRSPQRADDRPRRTSDGELDLWGVLLETYMYRVAIGRR